MAAYILPAMSYHIPSDEQVVSALEQVFSQYRTITTQHELKEIIEKTLNKETDECFFVGATRVRRLALIHNIVDVKIEYREGDFKGMMGSCPVCGAQLKRVKNKTVFGGEVTIERRCAICGFWTARKKRTPARYVFHRKE